VTLYYKASHNSSLSHIVEKEKGRVKSFASAALSSPVQRCLQLCWCARVRVPTRLGDYLGEHWPWPSLLLSLRRGLSGCGAESGENEHRAPCVRDPFGVRKLGRGVWWVGGVDGCRALVALSCARP
jgi:hypothetical protein